MNNLVTNFNQVLDFSKKMNMPLTKKRGIVREYLQSKFISNFYTHKKSKKMIFVGGTSLRLLRNIPRFSEDLDFDNHGLTSAEIKKLVENTTKSFLLENIEVELKTIKKGNKNYFTINFSRILFDLKITTNPKEKLKIKIDYNNNWKLNTEVVLINKYGFLEQVITNKLSDVLQQKLTAYTQRKQVQSRDIYDIVWIFSQQPELFNISLEKNKKLKLLLIKAQIHLKKHKITKQMKNRLRPFLFTEKEVSKLDIFEKILLKSLKK